MIETRPCSMNRYFACYYKRIGNNIKKVTKMFNTQTRAEAVMKIAEEIGSSEIVGYRDNIVGIKYITLKSNDSNEEYFKERMYLHV